MSRIPDFSGSEMWIMNATRQGRYSHACETGDNSYHCRFLDRLHQVYGTGVPGYHDPAECAVSLLQVQADCQAKLRPAENPS